VEREFLERCLAADLSLREIGELAGRDASTVGYWLKKHGLSAAHRERYAARGAIARSVLEDAVASGASLREMAMETDRSITTVRYWLKKYGLTSTGHGRSRVIAALAREEGITCLLRQCSAHGETEFVLESRGYYRCVKCRREAVARWRRSAKRRLVEGGGGACVLCGYDKYQGALQFHHLDPATKRFQLSRGGNTRAFAELKAEADRCVLLCANCHAEVEAGVAVVPKAGR
jgi:hypothetical protein